MCLPVQVQIVLVQYLYYYKLGLVTINFILIVNF